MRQCTIVNPNQPVYADGRLALDFTSQSVTLDGDRLHLTRKEYQLLAYMVQHAGEIIRRDTLLKELWGYGPEIRTRTLHVHVRSIRRKFGRYMDGRIETLFGIGYRFQSGYIFRLATASVAGVPVR